MRAFEGCLLFDESHRAKSLHSGEGGKRGSKAAPRVMDLQRELPQARVVY